MNHSVEVIIPWFPKLSDDLRGQSFKWVHRQYLDAGFTVRVAECPSERFCKGDALLPALRDSMASTVVVADADVWCDGLPRAIEAVRWDCEGWAKPHKLVHRLDLNSSADYMDGEKNLLKLRAMQRPYIGLIGGGIMVLPRELALDIPIDSRFVGWGGEDYSWGLALHTLAGPPWLGQSDMIHLFHYPQERITRKIGNAENEKLRKRYLDAAGREARMRKLVDECQKP